MRCIRGGVGREKRVGREVNGMEGSGEKGKGGSRYKRKKSGIYKRNWELKGGLSWEIF